MGEAISYPSSLRRSGSSALSPLQVKPLLQSIAERFATLHSPRRALVPPHTRVAASGNWLKWDSERVRFRLHFVRILAKRHTTSCLPGSFLLLVELV